MDRKIYFIGLLFFLIGIWACPAPAQQPAVTVGTDTMLTKTTAVVPVTVAHLPARTFALEFDFQADSTILAFQGIVVSESSGVIATVRKTGGSTIHIQTGQGTLHQVNQVGDHLRVMLADSATFQDGLLFYLAIQSVGTRDTTTNIHVAHTVLNDSLEALATIDGHITIFNRQVADLNLDGVEDIQDALLVMHFALQHPDWLGRGQQPGKPLWWFQRADRDRNGLIQALDSALILREMP